MHGLDAHSIAAVSTIALKARGSHTKTLHRLYQAAMFTSVNVNSQLAKTKRVNDCSCKVALQLPFGDDVSPYIRCGAARPSYTNGCSTLGQWRQSDPVGDSNSDIDAYRRRHFRKNAAGNVKKLAEIIEHSWISDWFLYGGPADLIIQFVWLSVNSVCN